MHRLPVRSIMQTKVITVSPDRLAVDAANLLEEFNIRRLPVVDEEACLIGFVTDSDIRDADTVGRLQSAYEPGAEAAWLSVADIMTRDVVTVGSDTTVGELATLFIAHKIGGVPVVEPDPVHPNCSHVVGIVTETDIFKMIAEAWENERHDHPST